MEEFETESSLDELARLCDELGLDHMDAEACACETHIFIDAEGNPHECWEAGFGHVNVAVAMTPEQAVHITDFEKLRELLQDYHRYEYEDCYSCRYINECRADESGRCIAPMRLNERYRKLGVPE